MGNYKDKNKKKIKRKKGKKFVYRGPTDFSQSQISEKKNPFEELSKKKFMKQGKHYDGLINEYQGRFSSNSFIDRRIGENSKSLSYDDKMKLRFKAQQMINLKSKKNKFSLLDEEAEGANEFALTHRGKRLNEVNISDDDLERSDDEFYDKIDNYMEEMDNNRGKLSRKEIIQNIIAKSKMLKEEKLKIKQENKDKIQLLDENFGELQMLLKKRGRSFNKFNDDYDRFASNFVYAQKTHPTDRIKSEEEIAYEKEMEIEKLNKRKIKEEIAELEEEERAGKKENNDLLEETEEKKKLTKKERIEKLIEDRLKKAGKISKEDVISKRKKKQGDSDEESEGGDADEDNLSDLDEFEESQGEDFEEGNDENDDDLAEDDFDFEEDDEENEDFEDNEEDEAYD